MLKEEVDKRETICFYVVILNFSTYTIKKSSIFDGITFDEMNSLVNKIFSMEYFVENKFLENNIFLSEFRRKQ